MKRMIVTFNWSRGSRKWRALLVTGRTFAIMSISSMAFFIAIGLGDIVHQSTAASPGSTMKGFAANVSGAMFSDMLEMEVPAFKSDHDHASDSVLSTKQVSAFLLQLVTDINPNNPQSLLAREMPGLSSDEPFLIRKGSGNETAVGPEDHPPIPDNTPSGSTNSTGNTSNNGTSGTGASTVDPHDPVPDETDDTPDTTTHDTAAPGGADKTQTPPADDTNPPAKSTDDKLVFIYHSHNRESWFPVVGGESNDPTSSKQNITLVGKRLASKLEELGLGASDSDYDYPTKIKNYKWALSYKYSRTIVQEALATNKDLKYIFDIHRDSQKRKYTTTTINGKDYAQVYFIIGQENPNWRQNEKLATNIHKALEAKYPGISRGVWGKTSKEGNGEYNQSLSNGSVLIEIGGVDNTLEESYRTADALAEIIADLYWGDAKKVTAPKES
ncbi:stage II sporulation protein P [Paenibacillus cellulosilyticus]|uniref:Stage II sporulation protein P n=1 Tax=Paenibacillus cellulosilyticus TaxID=375489 RepID=A0A2V2YT01_9BACL|nr:stage II sporulation protein P [Paenibacillus cellulosilyticus]PWV98401.1 stage II sporulation protein P [Paenibacillus cellulosilyticus]QKS43250.1 stage II sporulation protein P [Paenibacillus cellulosilyticus]